MKIFRISEKNIPYYLDLIPTDFHSLIYREEFTAFGLIDEKDGKAIPAGLMILSGQDPEVTSIEWLYISEEYQGQGHGDDLIAFAMEMAKRCKLDRVQLKTYIPEWQETIEPEEGMYSLESWFLERGFLHYFSNMTDKVFYFDTMKKDIVCKNTTKCDDVVSFSKLPESVMSGFLLRLQKTYGFSYSKSIDMDNSVAILKDKKIAMALTVRRFGNTFIPADIYISSAGLKKKDVLKLVITFMQKAYNEVGDEGFLHLTCKNDSPLTAIQGLFEDGKAITAITSRASVNSYEEQIEEIKYELASEKAYQKGIDAIPENAEIVEIEYLSGVQI